MPQKLKIKPFSTRPQDYPSTLSGFERESLAAEAKLKAKLRKQPKSRKA
jgi:hypothetical protein